MGHSERLPDRLDPALEALFPNLRNRGYIVSSHCNPRYNCVAHAANDYTQNWDCTSLPLPGYYWPYGAIRSSGIEALVIAFEHIGYEICAGGHVEEAYDKVALYVDQWGFWTHAAKQEDDGIWSSKIGEHQYIRHPTPHALSGPEYGQVMYYMRRPKRGQHETTEEA